MSRVCLIGTEIYMKSVIPIETDQNCKVYCGSDSTMHFSVSISLLIEYFIIIVTLGSQGEIYFYYAFVFLWSALTTMR